MLRRLAVHAEGCSLAAAEEVCAGGDGDVSGADGSASFASPVSAASDGSESVGSVAAGDVLGLLARLVDRSLVVAVDGPDGPRYRLLESVAAYCLERLRDADEAEAVRERHLTHYLRLAEDAGPALRGPDQRRRLAHLDAETSNLRAALDRTLAAPGTGRNGEVALRLVDALAWYWVMRGRLGEALRSATAALRPVEEGTARPEPAALRARVEVWRTGLAVMGGDGTDRQGRIAKALTAYDEAGPRRPADRAWARWFLSHALCGTGSQSEGGHLTAEALDGARAHGDRWVEAAALADRSVQRLLGGDVTGAEEDAARSDTLFAEVGDACCCGRCIRWRRSPRSTGSTSGRTGSSGRVLRRRRASA